MFNLLSPGVQISEYFVPTGLTSIATTGAALAGAFTWGPANVVTLINNENNLVQTFGEPDNDSATAFFSAASFLQYGNNLNIVRALNASARNATVIDDSVTEVEITNAGTGYNHVPTLAFSSGTATASATVANGEIVDVTITDPGDGYSPSSPPTITVTPTGGDIITEYAVLTPYIGVQIQNITDYTTNFAAGQVSTAGEFAARCAGVLGNGIQIFFCDSAAQFPYWTYKNQFTGAPGTSTFVANRSGSKDQLHIVVVDNTGVITGTPGTILEKFAFVSKASDAQNASGQSIYYPYVLQTQSQWIYWLAFPTGMTNWGTPSQSTTYDVYCSAPTAATLTVGSSNAGIKFTAVTPGTSGNSITITYTNPMANNTLSVSVTGTAINVDLGYASSAITSTAANVLAAINASTAAKALVSGALTGTGASVVTAETTTPLATGANAVTYVSILEGGNTGNDNLTDGDLINAYDFLLSQEVSYGLLITADHDSNVVEYCIQNISEIRQDNVTFVSPKYTSVVNNVGNEVTDVVNDINVYAASSYAFFDGNWLQMYDKYNDLYRWIPANGSVAGLCTRTDYTRDPWFSPAGLNRGILSGVTSLAWNPNQTDRDVLYQAGVNPIVSFPGLGALLFGDVTMLHDETSPFNHINVRRLFIIVEQSIAKAAKYVLFEFNDDTTRTQFVGLVNPYLADIQGRRGVYAFEVVCDASNNTGQVIDANGFQADIYLQPEKSINYIQLNFIATPTGVSFSEIVGQF